MGENEIRALYDAYIDALADYLKSCGVEKHELRLVMSEARERLLSHRDISAEEFEAAVREAERRWRSVRRSLVPAPAYAPRPQPESSTALDKLLERTAKLLEKTASSAMAVKERAVVLAAAIKEQVVRLASAVKDNINRARRS